MEFFLQLKLLLWKNLIHRRRHWLRLTFEILWPLFLFLILVLVRTRGLRKEHHQCFFDEKAMPSAGLVAFAQSFICTFNNTCHAHIREDFTQSNLLAYNDTFINTFDHSRVGRMGMTAVCYLVFVFCSNGHIESYISRRPPCFC